MRNVYNTLATGVITLTALAGCGGNPSSQQAKQVTQEAPQPTTQAKTYFRSFDELDEIISVNTGVAYGSPDVELGDLDGDGDLDLIVTKAERPQFRRVFENRIPQFNQILPENRLPSSESGINGQWWGPKYFGLSQDLSQDRKGGVQANLDEILVMWDFPKPIKYHLHHRWPR